MKILYLILICLLPYMLWGQEVISMQEAESRPEISMSEVDGRSANGTYRYYVKGSNEPFTGVLYATHPNGQFSTWQEYEEGVGQGTWINYYENGNFKEIGHYEQNRVEGPIRKFYPNGQLKAVGMYKNWRIRVGEWKYYDEAGKLMRVEDYGQKGNLAEVEEYLDRGEISYSWYKQIRTDNGF